MNWFNKYDNLVILGIKHINGFFIKSSSILRIYYFEKLF